MTCVLVVISIHYYWIDPSISENCSWWKLLISVKCPTILEESFISWKRQLKVLLKEIYIINSKNVNFCRGAGPVESKQMFDMSKSMTC